MPCPAPHGPRGLGVKADAHEGRTPAGGVQGRPLTQRGRRRFPPGVSAAIPGGISRGSSSGLPAGWEAGYGPGIMEAEALVVVLDWQAHLVAHEIHITLDSLRGDLEFFRDLAT